MRLCRSVLLVGLALAAVSAAAFAQARQDPYVRYPAPKKEQPAIRSVVGEVVNSEGGKLAQAVVYLKNKKTLDVQTRISDKDGKFSFRGLDREADYELRAEYRGVSSEKKNVSLFDNRDEVTVTLQIDTAAH